MEPSYRRYFDIDPDYFPIVNYSVIQQEPDLWKKFYPHETFIALIKQTISVLNRAQKSNIWVEGAYGTGKSHAVLTLKHLLDATPDEVRGYFKRYNIDKDICEALISARNSDDGGPLITIHRYGSSSIDSESDLFLAMQESIEDELEKVGIKNAGPNALRDVIINYLSDEVNKSIIETCLNHGYSNIFGGNNIDTIIDNLRNYSDESLRTLINNLLNLGKERGIKPFAIDAYSMASWVKEIIQENELKGIVFIWDEFTEYFHNNTGRLTGFQRILELSEEVPFCFIPVTHKSEALFNQNDIDGKKILDRFIRPTSTIELPENMAFKLMGQAMRVKQDVTIRNEWDEIKKDLYKRTQVALGSVKSYAKINDEELLNILPIHPYTACVLKQISSNFASNQRSMFDFIKNTSNEENKGFQWYIDNFGPYDDGGNPFLTIDLLWGFFYETGKSDLSESIRHILDQYGRVAEYLDDDDQRVLKTVLILQAMHEQSGRAIDMYQPNDDNLICAFEGTDLEGGKAIQRVQKLVEDKRIYKKVLRDDKFMYSALSGDVDTAEIEKRMEELKNRPTIKLFEEGGEGSVITLQSDLRLRFRMHYVGISDFSPEVKKINNIAESDSLHFHVVACLSKNNEESASMTIKIQQFVNDFPKSRLIFLDCAKTPLGDDAFNKWLENRAYAEYHHGKDNNQSAHYSSWAKQELLEWRTRLASGKGVLYNQNCPKGVIIHNVDNLADELRKIDRKQFPLALECNFKSIDPWWLSNSLPLSVECGVTRTRKGTYTTNSANLEQMLSFAWVGDEKYWLARPSEPISQIKVKLEEFVQERLNREGRIPISDIYNFLSDVPFGFLPCNMSAFFMGFLLKEYVANTYSWSDGDVSDTLSLDKMKEMITDVISPKQRYKEKYIVIMSPEEKRFIEDTAEIFNIPNDYCTSVESAVSRLRVAMKNNMSFPIWTVVEILDTLKIPAELKTDIGCLILDYQELANNTTGQADSNIAKRIGKTFKDKPETVNILRENLTKENCKAGMEAYLKTYRDGELIRIANGIRRGVYLDDLKGIINADDATWLWKKETINQQIDSLIVDYHIVEETKKFEANPSTYEDAIKVWRERVTSVKLNYGQIKNYKPQILSLLDFLRELSISGSIQENKKQEFLEEIQIHGEGFNDFYKDGQTELFRTIFKDQLHEFTDENKSNIFIRMPSGLIDVGDDEYARIFEEVVEKYRKEQASIQLRKMWKEKTGTDSPSAWSDKYMMPILAMFPDNEATNARTILDIINNSDATDKQVEQAIKYLEKVSNWDDISDETKRDRMFREKILKENALLVDNLEELKKYLKKNSSEQPYNWMGNLFVERVIQKFAQIKYDDGGWTKVKEKIEPLPANDFKKRMEELIKKNMSLGIQIMKTMS